MRTRALFALPAAARWSWPHAGSSDDAAADVARDGDRRRRAVS